MILYVKPHTHALPVTERTQSSVIQWHGTKALLMRASILAILLSVSGLLIAGNGKGQDLDKVIVSVQFKNVSLKGALKIIEKQTRLPFTYRTNDVSPFDNISYEARNIALTKILSDLLKNTGLQYELVNSNIVISRTRVNFNPNVMAVANSEPQPFDGSIRGRITSQDGQPVPNASITIAGTNKGTIANQNGEF